MTKSSALSAGERSLAQLRLVPTGGVPTASSEPQGEHARRRELVARARRDGEALGAREPMAAARAGHGARRQTAQSTETRCCRRCSRTESLRRKTSCGRSTFGSTKPNGWLAWL